MKFRKGWLIATSAYCIMCNVYSCMCNAQCKAWPQFWQHHIRYIFTPGPRPGERAVHLQPAAQLSPICRDSPYMSSQLKCCGSYYKLVYVLGVVVGGRETILTFFNFDILYLNVQYFIFSWQQCGNLKYGTSPKC